MKKTLFALPLLAIGMIAMSSCEKKDTFVGTWQAMQPTDIASDVPGASTATTLNSLTFEKDGTFMISSVISATQPVVTNPDMVSGYEVSVAATASISGTWQYAPHEDDDLLIAFDQSSLKVNVDPDGVTFRQNLVSEAQEPITDSLTNVTAQMWQHQLTSAMIKEYNRYVRLDDVKSKDGKTLKVEIEHPDQDLYFMNTAE